MIYVRYERQKKALKSGGLLFVTAPAFRQFWSYNDELVHHLRRYRSQNDNESSF